MISKEINHIYWRWQEAIRKKFKIEGEQVVIAKPSNDAHLYILKEMCLKRGFTHEEADSLMLVLEAGGLSPEALLIASLITFIGSDKSIFIDVLNILSFFFSFIPCPCINLLLSVTGNIPSISFLPNSASVAAFNDILPYPYVHI